MLRSAAYPLWVQAVGGWSRLGGNSNSAPVDTSIGGIFLGGDASVGNGWRAGGAFGYTYGDIDVDDRSSSSNVNSYTAAVYGGKSWAVRSDARRVGKECGNTGRSRWTA